MAEHFCALVPGEAQAIENPSSETASICGQIKAQYCIAPTGTPVANRLLDLWSIMNVVQPGILGSRTYFTKNYDAAVDPLARRRLATRINPFVLRRTKDQVLRELPTKTEKIITAELSSAQKTLYNVEVKRVRYNLLGIKTPKEFKSSKIYVLASLTKPNAK